MTNPHIVVAEDEPKIAEILRDYLASANMDVSHVDDGARVIERVKCAEPDLLILDLMLPNKDGMTICREIRQFSTLPIIILTARVEEIDRLLGLELGADDYVCKPFSPREMVARVKAVLRRTEPSKEANIAVGIEIDERKMEVIAGGHKLELTPVEFRLLKTLTRHAGRVYRREELLDAIYEDYRVVSDRTVDSHVKNLRRKLDQALPNQSIIRSIYGVGYKFDYE
ncbi:MAG: response regulator [Gammaproteobacteria bacterium]